jgi:peptidoglycan/LPS O-acetylase OafA/YrhL
MHGGGVGVDVFFGISGFLITYLLIKEIGRFGRLDLKKFWLRRLLRLMPALIVLILCVDVFALVVNHVKPNEYLMQSIEATPSVLLYFSNWMIVGTDSSYLGWFGPLWSLSVEEQFYLAWPLIVVLAFRSKKPLLLLTVLAIVISVGSVATRFITFDGSNLFRTFGTDFRVDMLLAGALLAIVMHAGHERIVGAVSKVLVAPGIVYLVVVALIVPEFSAGGTETATRVYYTFGLPFVALSTVAILGFLITNQSSMLVRALSWKPLAYTGKISYGMYLWHYPIVLGLSSFLPLDETVIFVLCLALTYAAATFSWKFVEQPLSERFHDRLKVKAPTAQLQRTDVGTR